MEEKNVVFVVKRFYNDSEEERRYEFTASRGMTVLDGLYYIKDHLDATLAFRASCRMGICGSCGMIINGRPMLACSTQIFDLDSDIITVEPLKNMDGIKDLVADFNEFFEKHKKVKPYLIRKVEKSVEEGEYIQTPDQLKEYRQYALCIKCGLCYSVCAIAGSNNEYLGPASLASAYRFMKDNRDEGGEERLLLVDGHDGCWRCHFMAECSEVCPKEVDPAKAIQMIKRKAFIAAFKRLFRR
jgi:succinate dehydrogenase / fumarate reductase iron-sulfur subunit